jgi:hypothetical protein
MGSFSFTNTKSRYSLHYDHYLPVSLCLGLLLICSFFYHNENCNLGLLIFITSSISRANNLSLCPIPFFSSHVINIYIIISFLFEKNPYFYSIYINIQNSCKTMLLCRNFRYVRRQSQMCYFTSFRKILLPI